MESFIKYETKIWETIKVMVMLDLVAESAHNREIDSN